MKVNFSALKILMADISKKTTELYEWLIRVNAQ